MEVNEYIGDAWEAVTVLTRSFKWEKGTDELRARFQSHIDAEETRLRKNLDDIKYGIDSYDVVRLISGNGRTETVWFLPFCTSAGLTLEQTLFPMIYLVLSRDLQKISLARKHVLADSELPDCLETIYWITTVAASYRIADLRGEIFPYNPLSQLTWPSQQYSGSRIYPLRNNLPFLLRDW